MKTIKIFTSDKCPLCPQAKRLGTRLADKGFATRFHNVDTANGLAEAALSGVFSTPSILVVDRESEVVIQDWRGVLPTEDEVLHALK